MISSETLADPAPMAGPVQARRLGIENMAAACVQGRGVLIDLHAAFGSERNLVGYDDLARACDRQGVAVGSGDLVCLHTGFTDALLGMGGKPDEAALDAPARCSMAATRICSAGWTRAGWSR